MDISLNNLIDGFSFIYCDWSHRNSMQLFTVIPTIYPENFMHDSDITFEQNTTNLAGLSDGVP